MPAKQTDWVAIEGLYRADARRSIRSIADEYGVTEGAVRARAKKHGWTRDPQSTKRELVRAAMSGASHGVTHGEVRNLIESEADRDVADMQAGLYLFRKSLRRLDAMLDLSEEAKDIKVIVESAKIAVDGIRRIRGLDGAVIDDDQVVLIRREIVHH